MANKEKNVVLNFKMDGQVQYADTLKEINAVMNTAAKEYKNHIAAMGKDAKATDKLAAEKKKLEIQMQAAEKRTGMLRAQYEAMSKDTKTTTGQLTQMYSKLLDAERAETSLQKAMERVNDGLSDQAEETRGAEEKLKSLKDQSEKLEEEQKKLTSSYKLQASQLGKNASETEKFELSQRQVKDQMALTERAVQNLEKQLVQTKKVYGENSVQVLKMETRLNEARATVNKFKNSLEQVEDKSEKATKSLKGLGSGIQGLAGAAPAAAIGGLVSSMQEYNEVLARLRTNAATSGRDLGIVEESFTKITAVTGEADAAGETLANLLASGFSDNQLAEAIDLVNGAYIKFSDTLKTEGIADGIQETLAAGEAVGPFAELLERSGVNVDNFNSTLSTMISMGEGSNYILKTLSQEGFSEVYNKYQELNPEVQANAEANAQMEKSLADLALILTPLVTQVADFTTKVIEWANENPELTATIGAGAAAIGGLITVLTIAAPIMTAITMAAGAMGISITAATWPILAIIVAIAAVIAIGVLLYKNWDTIQKKAVEMAIAVITKFNELKNGAIEKINGLRDKASSVMDQTKNKITSPIESAKDTIGGYVREIIGFFKGLGDKLKFNIPKPKLPHFSIKGKFDLMPPGISVPTIGVDWRAKGAIFTTPTIFGQNGGRLQGAGDAGPEAALPLNEQTLGDIGKGIAATMGGTGGQVEVHVYVDSDELTTKLAPGMSKKINKNNKINARGQGVIIT
jgi:hypothetical protein